MSSALKQFANEQVKARTATPQRQRTPGRNDEVQNNAGGFVFQVSDKTRLERFLILGTDGGTFYVGQRALTEANVKFIKDMIAKDEQLVISALADVARNNRAAKNDPAIFTLALLMHNAENKAAVRAIVNDVVRTSTHLFDFTNYLKSLGGLGRAKRGALADWYTTKSSDSVAYQAVKYRQRNGVTHRDVFRLAHPKGVDPAVGGFILGKDDATEVAVIEGFRRLQKATSVKEVVAVLNEYKNLPWETIPTQFLNDPAVWKTLFANGALGQTALLRNVTRLAKMDAFKDLVFAGDVAARLADSEAIAKGRVHPVAYANALGVYTKGRVVDMDRRTGVEWKVNPKVAGALEDGFYASFDSVEPANKATMLAIDVSGSMTWQAPAGLVGLDCLEAAAAMAMVSVRTEPYVMVTAFSGGWAGRELTEVNISDKDSLATAIQKVSRVRAGGTDCALPMVYAEKNKIGIDTFVVYTDNETWAGNIKPSQALVKYRKSQGRDSRLVVVGMTATKFTIADPKDSGMLDVVGMDSSAPAVLANFSAGRI